MIPLRRFSVNLSGLGEFCEDRIILYNREENIKGMVTAGVLWKR